MSGFPSIDDLLQKKSNLGPAIKTSVPNNNQKSAPVLQIASDDTTSEFDKKMKSVLAMEKEREAIRYASQIGFPEIDLDRFPVSQEALRQVPEDVARELGAVCFFATQDEVRVGAIDPTDTAVQDLLQHIQEKNHASGGLYVISENSLERVLKLYKNLPIIKPISKDVDITKEDLDAVQADVKDFSSLQTLLQERSASEILIILLGAALKLSASDVHIEAEEDRIVVRLRLDGILHDAATLEKEDYPNLVSRIKLTSSLKLNIDDKPQDGRFTIKMPEGDIDVRVSTMPTVYGESVVMRLLLQSMEGLDLDSLGLRDSAYVTLKREIERPNGMIITTGPTGSGKTTTMYSILKILNQPGVKIITLEDPVEYKMPGVNQSQVDISHDYTFAKGLRSILRQDPDIAMVGEIRDLETAEIAIQGALTGHLILSTIHTNDAAGAIPRFLSMGVKPFLLAPALNCVIGQRLVRRICSACMKEQELDSHAMERVGEVIESMNPEKRQHVDGKQLKFYVGTGCKVCGGIGYKGRLGIYEVFIITPEIEQMILDGHVSEYEIRKKAIEQGMVTMAQDGLLKALDKLTSLEEVFRVTE